MSRNCIGTYSPEELADLHEVHYSLVEREVFNYRPGGAIWQSLHGSVAELPLGIVLRMVDAALREPSHDLHNLLAVIGGHLAFAIRDNDADYFRRFAVVLEARKQRRKISSLTRKELLLPPKRGRAKTPHDLSRTFPLALMKLTGNRFELHALPGEFCTARITRDEIKKELRTPISEPELSRWLSRFNFGRFMAEQPIARKPRKTG